MDDVCVPWPTESLGDPKEVKPWMVELLDGDCVESGGLL